MQISYIMPGVSRRGGEKGAMLCLACMVAGRNCNMPHKHTHAAQWATWDFSQVKQTAGHNQKHKKKYGKKQKTKESQISSCAT